ncbi:MAG: hypothetical protein LBQ83_02275 [Candidatus Margulisbacteria bacterium]|jgi:hypothetical protein|nr:hypothetical protein [Candidatus Margulisiibacteriota bacterium]
MVVAKGQPMLAQDMLDITFFPKGTILMMDGSWTDVRGGWYICDGRKTPYGNTPNLTDRFIRGGVTAGGTGGGTVTLVTANLPAHGHTLSGLTLNTTGIHKHTVSGTIVTGGAHTHPVTGTVESGGGHTHDITDPGHNHSVGRLSHDKDGSDNDAMYGGGGYYSSTDKTGITIKSVSAHGHTFSSGTATSAGGHNHTFSSGSAADAGGHTHTISGGTISNTGSGTAFNIVPSYYVLIYIKKMV